MAQASSGDSDVYDQINVTPLLDLAYVLLIIFIILTTATVQGIKVNLPKASAQPSLAENKTKAISITADGTIYLDTFPVTMPELENLLRQYKAVTPDLPVIIITGFSTESSAIEAVNLGVAGYLTKPFRVPQVLAAAARALGE